jgi:hypothetical protein
VAHPGTGRRRRLTPWPSDRTPRRPCSAGCRPAAAQPLTCGIHCRRDRASPHPPFRFRRRPSGRRPSFLETL